MRFRRRPILQRASGSLSLIAVAACSTPGPTMIQPDANADACSGSGQAALLNASDTESYLGLSESQRSATVKVVNGNSPIDGPLCSGAFVARDWVVTAQHCLVIPMPVVLVGGTGTGSPIVSLSVVRSVPHPSRDVALLQVDLAGPDAGVEVDGGGPRVSPLLFASSDASPLAAGDVVDLAGYGLTESGDQRELRFLAESIVDIDDTNVTVSGFGANGACEGDSGGPLLVRAADGSVVVAGVLSAGSITCVEEDKYVRLDAVRDWAMTVIGADVSPDVECGTITERGRCLYGNAIWCVGNELTAERCKNGTECGWDVDQGAYRCVSPSLDPCLGVDSMGACRGSAALVCNDGALVRENCEGCSVCRVAGRTGRAHCASAL